MRTIPIKIVYDEIDCREIYPLPALLIRDIIDTIKKELIIRITKQPKSCNILLDYNEENDKSKN